MARYRHWKNWGEGGEVIFLSTAVLDFAPVFRNTEFADLMAASLLSDHRHYGAALFAFVVMPSHIHTLSGVPAGRDASWLI